MDRFHLHNPKPGKFPKIITLPLHFAGIIVGRRVIKSFLSDSRKSLNCVQFQPTKTEKISTGCLPKPVGAVRDQSDANIWRIGASRFETLLEQISAI